MKRTIIFTKQFVLLLLCMATLSSVSAQQYSNTYPYTVSTNPTDLFSVDVINLGGGNTVNLATRDNDKIALTKFDYLGHVVWDEVNVISGLNGGSINPTKVIEKQNGEFIVVGMYTDFNNVNNPFAALFDNTGIYVFGSFTIYASNQTSNFRPIPGFTRVNIVMMQNTQSGAEEYLITAPGETPYPHSTIPSLMVASMFHDNDVVINAVSVDAGLGQLWNKKYFVDPTNPITARQNMRSQNPNHPNAYVHIHADHPHGLAHVYDNSVNTDKYVITGTTWQQLQYFIGSPAPGNANGAAFNNYYTFIIAIDNNGNELAHNNNPYHGEYTYNYPFGHNQLWDQGTNEVVMSYTIGNTNIASTNGTPATPIPASVIGVMKLDQNTLNVVGSTSDFYYLVDATENYAYGIIENDANDGYVIGAWIYDENTHAGNPAPDDKNANIAILEVDKSTAAINYYHRFNIYEETLTAAITGYNYQGLASYVLAGTKGTSGVNPQDIRMISADATGYSCCTHVQPNGLGTINHSTVYEGPQNFYEHLIYDAPFQDDMTTPTANTTRDDCFLAIDCTQWKPSNSNGLAIIEESKLNIYPTILEDGSNSFNIELNAIDATNITLAIYSIDGRKVAEQAYDVNKGSNKFTWNVELPTSGNYIIKTQSTDEALQGNIRITKL